MPGTRQPIWQNWQQIRIARVTAIIIQDFGVQKMDKNILIFIWNGKKKVNRCKSYEI